MARKGESLPQNDRLFKYTKLKHIPSILDYGIFASPINDLNDPYEYKDIENAADYRIVCLSRSNNAKLMWSHYADSHKGCTVQIELPEGYGTDECILHRVKYSSKYQSRIGLEQADIIDNLYIKDKKWGKELEVRAVCHINNLNPAFWRVNDGKVYFKTKIKAIYLGCSVDTASKEYISCLKKIEKYNLKSDYKVEIKKYKMDNKQFRFIIDNDYIYHNEIERLL